MIFFEMTRELLLGTSNPGKIQEMREALASLDVKILSPEERGILASPKEHGDTFEANALEKARFYFQKSGIPTLADDSGILVEALAKELGIHTRRWGAGPTANDEGWIQYFLNRMKTEKNKRARFVCVLAYIDAEGNEFFFEGTCDGEITETLEASYLPGLPISACFRPEGFNAVYSGLSVHEKNHISHRGRAMHKFVEHLKSVEP